MKEEKHRLLTDEKFEEEKKKDAERKKNLEKRRQDDRRRTQEIISIVSGLGQQINASNNIISASSNNNLNLTSVEVKRTPSFTRNIDVDNTQVNTGRQSFKSEVIEEFTKIPSENISSPIVSTTTTTITTTVTATNNTSNMKQKKDRNRTRSIRDKYRLPMLLPEPSIKGFFTFFIKKLIRLINIKM